jgi:hypothetical protein
MSEEIDIGDNHFIEYTHWHPEDLEANRLRYGVPLPDVPKAGLILRHLKPSGEGCSSGLFFDLPEIRKHWPSGAKFWKVESWEPLTISPSVLCLTCGDHGFIREGRWVKV